MALADTAATRVTVLDCQKFGHRTINHGSHKSNPSLSPLGWPDSHKYLLHRSLSSSLGGHKKLRLDFLAAERTAVRQASLGAGKNDTHVRTKIRFKPIKWYEELGTDRPPNSGGYNSWWEIGDPHFKKILLLELFLLRLPVNVWVVLVSTPLMSLDDLTKLADRILEFAVSTVLSIDQILGQTETRQSSKMQISKYPMSSGFTELRQQVSELWVMVSSLVSRAPSPRLGRATTRPRYSCPCPRRLCHTNEGLSRYHYSFGDDARHCQTPCSA